MTKYSVLKLIIFMLFAITSFCSVSADYEMFDDFETGSLNTSKWEQTTGTPEPVTSIVYDGSYSYGIETGENSNSLTMSDVISTSGEYVLEFYAYYNDTVLGDDFQPLFKDNAGTIGFGLNGGLTVAGYWSYYVPAIGWADTGVSSNSGSGDIAQSWLRIRILIDNDNGDFSVRFGDVVSDDVSNISYGGVTDVQEIYLDPAGANSFYDNFAIWDYASYGWEYASSTPIPDTPSNFSLNARNRFDNSSVDNMTVYIGYNTTTTNSFRSWEDCDNGLVSSWDGRSFDDQCGRNNGTPQGDVFINSSGVFGNSMQFDGSDDYLDTSFNGTEYSNFSLSAWIYLNTSISDYRYIIDNSPGANGYALQVSDTNMVRFITYVDSTASVITTSYAIDLNNWYHVIAVHNSTHNSIYLNGILEDSAVEGALIDPSIYFAKIGRKLESNADNWLGLFDEVKVYNRSLTLVEISEMYRSSIHKYEGSVPLETDINNESSLQVFNITITKDDYFNQTFFDQDIVTNITDANMTQVVVSFTASELITNNSFSGGNITIAGFTKSLDEVWYLNASSYYVLFENNTHYDYNESNTFTSLQNDTVDLAGLYNTILNVTAYNGISGTLLSDIFVSVNNSLYDYWNTLTSLTGLIQIPLIANLTYTLTTGSDEDPGYVNVTNSTTPSNITELFNTTLYSINSVQFIFKYADDKRIANDTNVSMELISNVFAGNYSTTNGTIYVDLLVPTTYATRYYAPEYNENFYYFNLVNFTTSVITLYLTPLSYDNVSVSIIDEIGDPVEGAYVKVLHYDVETNSYLLHEVAATDFDGKVNVHIILNSEFYQFLIEYPFGTQIKLTQPSYIRENLLTIPVALNSAVAEEFYTTLGIDHAVLFNTATNNFRFEYADNDAIITEACIKVAKTSINDDVVINETCSSSATGILLVGVDPINGTTYEATGYVTINGETKVLQQKDYKFYAEDLVGKSGLLVVIILTMAMAFFWRSSKELTIALIPMPLALASLIEFGGAPLVRLSPGVTITLWIAALFVAIYLSVKGGSRG